jgi:hypothetical protein
MRSLFAPVTALLRREPPDAMMFRWRTVLEAARATSYYQRPSRRPMLDFASSLREQARCSEIPALFPPVELSYFFAHPGEFLNLVAPRPEPQPLHAPWSPLPRVAVLGPWFRLAPPARVFQSLDAEAVERFCPEALAGPMDSLREAARQIENGRLVLPDLRFGVIVFTGIGWPPLTHDDREFLWRVFGVPVTEQLRGFQGELLAHESDCRAGFHLCPENALLEAPGSGELLLTSFVNLRHPVIRLATKLRGEIDPARCGCANGAPRLIHLELKPSRTEGSQTDPEKALIPMLN